MDKPHTSHQYCPFFEAIVQLSIPTVTIATDCGLRSQSAASSTDRSLCADSAGLIVASRAPATALHRVRSTRLCTAFLRCGWRSRFLDCHTANPPQSTPAVFFLQALGQTLPQHLSQQHLHQLIKQMGQLSSQPHPVRSITGVESELAVTVFTNVVLHRHFHK